MGRVVVSKTTGCRFESCPTCIVRDRLMGRTVGSDPTNPGSSPGPVVFVVLPAGSSAGERHSDTVEAAGSIPASPTGRKVIYH